VTNLDLVLFNYSSMRRLLVAKWLEPRRVATEACFGEHHCEANWCCYQLPLSHLMEGVLVAARLQKAGRLAAELPDILEQGLVQHQLMLEGLPGAVAALGAGDVALAHEKAEAFSHRWYDKRELCCFHKGGRCSIYQDRPVMCSTYFVQVRCTRCPTCEEPVPMLDNTEVVHHVMSLSDLTYSELTGDPRMVAPVPFAYAVAAGSKLITGQELQCIAVG